MTWRATFVVTALLLASAASAQERLFLPSGEVSITNPFGSVIGPTYEVLRYPRIGGNRYAVTYQAVHDLASGATLPLPAGLIVGYDAARPRVFVSRADGVWAVNVVSALETRVLSRASDGLMACRHAASADLLVCAYALGDGQFALYRSAAGDPVHLVTLPILSPGVEALSGVTWTVTSDGTRTYAVECSRSSGSFCLAARLAMVDVESGAVSRASGEMTTFVQDPARLTLDEVRDRVIANVASDGTYVYTADLDLLGSAPTSGLSWREVAVSPHTDTVYVHTFVQSTYGSVSWVESMRADTYAPVHPRTLLSSIASGMALLSPPGAPRHVRADTSGGNVTVNWTNVGAASEFVIDIGLTAGRTDLSVPVTGGHAQASFANVPPGTYYLRVRGRNVIGTGRASQELAITVP